MPVRRMGRGPGQGLAGCRNSAMQEQTQVVGQPAPSPLAKRSEQEICATWKSDGPPSVTVFCSTYNHVRYIESALFGFLGQVTDFPFEIILVDDASTDGTTDIVRRFAAEYPRIIRPFIHKENNFQKSREGNGYVREFARGDIWAFCDGDDYWVYPHKLQTQADLLLSRPDVHLTFHRVLWSTDDAVVDAPEWPPLYDGLVKFADIERLTYLTPPTSSIVSRRFNVDKRCYNSRLFDRCIALIAGSRGLLCGSGEVWSVRRVHPAGIVGGAEQIKKLYTDAVSRFWICEIFPLSADAKAFHRDRARRNLRRILSSVKSGFSDPGKLLRRLSLLSRSAILLMRLAFVRR